MLSSSAEGLDIVERDITDIMEGASVGAGEIVGNGMAGLLMVMPAPDIYGRPTAGAVWVPTAGTAGQQS